VEGASVVVALDLEGVAASSGAACAEGEPEPSFVLQAMGFSADWGIGAVRFSLGRANTIQDVEAVLEVLPRVVARQRAEG
jgi:cysteine desulfurase